jgi:hypothetical protein
VRSSRQKVTARVRVSMLRPSAPRAPRCTTALNGSPGNSPTAQRYSAHPEDAEIDRDHDDERDRVNQSRDLSSAALRLVDTFDSHFGPSRHSLGIRVIDTSSSFWRMLDAVRTNSLARGSCSSCALTSLPESVRHTRRLVILEASCQGKASFRRDGFAPDFVIFFGATTLAPYHGFASGLRCAP